MSANWTNYKMQAVKAAQQSNLDEAERMWQEALKEAEQFGEKDGRFSLSVDNLGKVLFAQGKFEKAEPLYRKALIIRERTFPPDHDDVATCANNLAAVMFKREKYKEAEELYSRSLQIREKYEGKNSKVVANLLYQLGMVFHAQNRYEKAEDYYKQALEIKNKIFGPDHVELVHLLKNYAHLLRKTNREPNAVKMEQFAKSIEGKQGKQGK
ncbi:MAG: tetratricopeptide repeat protein [Candidatus Obscuribacterales bacterium]|nr:tetratricopeptide repeat protein [Candidatus Obscuribacterales bacterium]